MIPSAKDTQAMKGFAAFLTAAGAQVLEPTNEWEQARFRTGQGVSIIYTNSSGRWSLTNEAPAAWEAYRQQKPWRGAEKTGGQIKGSVIARTLRKRDGDNCFFCSLPVSVEQESVEHLVPRTAGGPNHISNFFLAHRVCNANAGHLSAPEKIRIHVEACLRLAITSAPAGQGVSQ